jgi:hypothetical protein
MKNVLVFLSVFFMMFFASCSDDASDSDTGGSSLTGSSSHNTGKNCLGCHLFKAAGSVYSKSLTSIYSGTVNKLSTGANGTGTVLASLNSDNTGNYYANNSINFGTGIYFCVTGTGGTVKHLWSAITNGASNSYHIGPVTSKIVGRIEGCEAALRTNNPAMQNKFI